MNTPRLAGPALLLALLAFAGCDSEAAQLAKEITDAKGDCTQEKLKAGDEACVAMMEKYAAIGTSAIETYIGAVKSMDQALQRMPPAAFDTAGFGHALTPARGDTGALSPSGVSASRIPSSGYFLDGEPRYPGSRYGSQYQATPDARTGGPASSDPRYADPRYADPRYADPRYTDPRNATPRYPDPRDRDPRASAPGYGDPWDAGAGYGDSRGYEPRYGDARGTDPRGAGRARPGTDPPDVGNWRGENGASGWVPPAPARRGLLLPPEQRLQRPWLREPEPTERDGRSGSGTARGGDPRAPLESMYLDSLAPDGCDRERDRCSERY